MLGLDEIAQPVLAEIAQLERRRATQLPVAPETQDLPAVADRHQPRGAVHRRPEVVAVALLGLAGVHAHAHRRELGGLAARVWISAAQLDAARRAANATANPSPPVANT